MAAIPKVKDLSRPFFCGKSYAQVIYNVDVAALLASQPHWKLSNGQWSGGGEFLTVSKRAQHNSLPLTWIRNSSIWNGAAAGVGNIVTALPAVGALSSSAPNVPSIVSSFGGIDDYRESSKVDFSKGWEKTRPGNPEASLAQFIAELRDFPLIPGSQAAKQLVGRSKRSRKLRNRPSFFRDWISGPVEQIPWKLQMQMGFFRSLGSEYLNHVFGWVPFVSDLQKLYVLSQTIDNRIKQIARDNNRGIRRKATVRSGVESSSTTKTITTGPFYGVLVAPPQWGIPPFGSSWNTTTKTETKVWFSARYRYYIPDVGSGAWIPKARTALYGANITPSVVWELTPWSWLVDWFGNVGTVLSNFSENAVENLTADYSFCMTHVKATTTSSSSGSWGGYSSTGRFFVNNVPGGSHSLSSTYVTEVKARVKGSPYGLGVQWSDLSGKQLSILAALGVTQSKF